ncbi:MAG TPA: prolyl oligopeptidase family serine peptidase [Gemmatimonadaceae bacterium]|nr:prolyl oligopeptidase family serine peptidase [Gemmatimonadaceae bacterium]
MSVRLGRLQRASAISAAFVLALAPAGVSAQSSATGTPTTAAGTAPSGAATARRALTLDDYGAWSRISSTALSPDGRWLTYTYDPNEGDATLHVRLLSDTTTFRANVGSNPQFSDDSRYAAFFVSPPEKEAEKLRKARKPVPRSAILLELATGHRDSIPNAAEITFAQGGGWVAVKRARTDTTGKAQGADVILRELSSGTTHHLGAVGDLAFNEPGDDAPSTMLAYAVDAANHVGNGAFVLELATGRTTPLATGRETFDGLTWNDAGNAVAILHGIAPDSQQYRANRLLVVKAPGGASPQRIETTLSSVPDGMVLSENATPRFSGTDKLVIVGLRAQEVDPAKRDEPVANVDVWHWKDPQIQSVQIVRANQDRRFTYAAVVDMSNGALRPLANDTLRTFTFTQPGDMAIARDELPYHGSVQWGGGKADYYAVNTSTGARTLIARGLTRTMGTSPDGRWFLYLDNGKVIARDLRGSTSVNLSDVAGIDFVDAEDDHPYERPVYGVEGWTADGRSVILNHRFDVWQVPLAASGKAVNLTRGVGDSAQIRFNLVRLDQPARGGRGGGGGGFRGGAASDDEGIDMSRPLVFSAYGEWTKKSGYWMREPNGMMRPILFDDESVGALARAEHGDRVIFTRQTFEEFPDVWTSPSVEQLAKGVQVTDANPQIAEFGWGRGVLVDYTNGKGQRLQGALFLPAGYEQGKKYPMVVYFYEKVSNRLHQFSMPVYDDRPHFSEYASDGYLVFMPDIVYEEGKPGSSALDCVTSGVKKVIELGYADPAHIGIQGHSWGGYESSFIITQTNMFKAAVIGAPPANLMSMYSQLYKNSGTANAGIFEIGQVRMGDGQNPWTAHELYESQSPVAHVRNIETPFLILHGTDDGAVDWLQGVEFYNAARRWGKQVILLSYPGENHHLAKKENTKDFQTRMKQFFDHYLKGAPAPTWMTDGVPHLIKGTEAALP